MVQLLDKPITAAAFTQSCPVHLLPIMLSVRTMVNKILLMNSLHYAQVLHFYSRNAAMRAPMTALPLVDYDCMIKVGVRWQMLSIRVIMGLRSHTALLLPARYTLLVRAARDLMSAMEQPQSLCKVSNLSQFTSYFKIILMTTQ